ncbi:MAG: AAA family ATPase [Polyangiales bacterium]
MIPSAVEFARYRCFEERTRVELRPLTLLYGRNNSGKSAVARAVPVLAGLASPANELGSLALESPAARKARFTELFHKGAVAGMELALHWPEGVVRSVRFAFLQQARRALISSLQVFGDGAEPLLVATWEGMRGGAPDVTPRKLRYDLRFGGSDLGLHTLAFRGVYPDLDESTVPDAARPTLHELATRLRAFAGSVQWLQASRPQADRIVAAIDATGGRPARLDPTGANAAAIVAARRDVGAYVSRWYHERAGAEFSVDTVGGNQVLSRFTLGTGHTSDLFDAGEGMIQVLPILTGAALVAHRAEAEPSILAMEEPESHLHGDLQLALAEDLCALAAQPGAGVLLIETHSEAFLLGVQRAAVRASLARQGAAVEGVALPHEALALYWAALDRETGASRLRRVTLDAESRLDEAWDSAAFDEIGAVSDELFTLRQKVRAAR